MPNLPSIQSELLAYIEANREELIDFAIRLVETPSHNPPGDEIIAAEVAAEQLRKLGLKDLAILESKPKRANLICTFDTGKPGKSLILNGHLDTKPPVPLEAWNTDPYKGVLKDGKLYGLGATDMKGPDSALVYGLAAVSSVGEGDLCGKVLLILSADEEYMAMEGPRFLVQDRGIRADSVLIAEPMGIEKSWECIPLISRGISCVRWRIMGTQTHSSISDRVPVVNASLEAGRLMLFLEENFELTYAKNDLCPLGPTVNLGATLKGGQAHAMVSGEAEFIADIRTLPGMTKEQLASDIETATEAFCRQHSGVEVSWEFFPGTLAWTQPTQIAPEEPLVRSIQSATEMVLGETPPLGYFPGGTDAVWWQGAGGMPTVPGFGPGLLAHCHQPNEYIVVEEVIRAAKIYALTIQHYLSQE
jgi:acetylornithine deacetylase/succinyl-diaminopimelate desuccinylase-like protein